jgi:hypothetical protein
MLRWPSYLVLGTALLTTTTSCGEEDPPPNPRAERCQRIYRATCAALVRCRALAAGSRQTFTLEQCVESAQSSVDECVTSAVYDGVGSATEADITACTDGMDAFPCSEICNRIPQDPAACQKLAQVPSENVIECAP